MTMDKGSYEAGIYRMGDVRIMDRSAEKRLPIGYDGFETVADRSLFVDKSLLVADILGGNYPITLFCRPRRFGKTLDLTGALNSANLAEFLPQAVTVPGGEILQALSPRRQACV